MTCPQTRSKNFQQKKPKSANVFKKMPHFAAVDK